MPDDIAWEPIAIAVGIAIGAPLLVCLAFLLRDPPAIDQESQVQQLDGRYPELFELQDRLIEHKFPADHIAIHEFVISCAGDIYREMTHSSPHYGYVYEKWSLIQKYATTVTGPYFTLGDVEEYNALMKESYYKPRRDEFLANLEQLKQETTKTPMLPRRKQVLLTSLDMVEALVRWFESGDVRNPPRHENDMLTDAIARYFPQFYSDEHSGNNPSNKQSSDRSGSLIVYRGLSDKTHEKVVSEGFHPTIGEEKLYTATKFGEALRFAYGHAQGEGGNPIVYQLRVPIGRFESQVLYNIRSIGWKATGFLTSGPLEASLIEDVIKIPGSIHETGKLILQKEKEEKTREPETIMLLAQIPEERVND